MLKRIYKRIRYLYIKWKFNRYFERNKEMIIANCCRPEDLYDDD